MHAHTASLSDRKSCLSAVNTTPKFSISRCYQEGPLKIWDVFAESMDVASIRAGLSDGVLLSDVHENMRARELSLPQYCMRSPYLFQRR